MSNIQFEMSILCDIIIFNWYNKLILNLGNKALVFYTTKLKFIQLAFISYLLVTALQIDNANLEFSLLSYTLTSVYI